MYDEVQNGCLGNERRIAMITDEQLLPFVNYDFVKNCKSEEDVKIKFVVKILELLGHKIGNMFFESNRKDILIQYGSDIPDIVIEVKHHKTKYWYSGDILRQLAKYCKKKRSLIALLTNGKELRIYYPDWDDRQQFKDKLVITINYRNLIAQKKILEDLLSCKYRTHKSLKQNILKFTYFYIEKVDILDYANYFGLIEQDQIMYCTNRSYPLSLILMCGKEKRNPKYKLSPKGEDFVKKRRFEGSEYFAEVEIVKTKYRIPLGVWQEICESGIFPYWNPKGGPHKFFRNKKANVALCRVYNMGVNVNYQDLGGGRVSQYLVNTNKLEEINLGREKWQPIMSEEKYQSKRKVIMDIIGEYVL